jgi:hypothetical protein
MNQAQEFPIIFEYIVHAIEIMVVLGIIYTMVVIKKTKKKKNK